MDDEFELELDDEFELELPDEFEFELDEELEFEFDEELLFELDEEFEFELEDEFEFELEDEFELELESEFEFEFDEELLFEFELDFPGRPLKCQRPWRYSNSTELLESASSISAGPGGLTWKSPGWSACVATFAVIRPATASDVMVIDLLMELDPFLWQRSCLLHNQGRASRRFILR